VLAKFWPFIFVLLGCFEAFAATQDFERPDIGGMSPQGNWRITNAWTAKEDTELGKYGLLTFDPLRLAPKDPEEYKQMQTMELNNGRLGMLAAGGIILQEYNTKQPFTVGLYESFDKICALLAFTALFEMTRFGAEKRWKFTGEKMKAAKQALAAQGAKPFNKEEYIASLPGISAPTGYFDPFGFLSGDLTEGQVKYFREAELKHGRLGMLAAAGILVGENFHPFFGGNIDGPAISALSAPELQGFWAIAIPTIMALEAGSIFALDIQEERGYLSTKNFWSISPIHEPGDYSFDPLDILPTDPVERERRQTQEINNGRLGMLGAGGMLVQEMITGEKILDTPNLVPSIAAAAGGVGLTIAVTLAFWDLAEDKNAGYQGTETQPRWKFAPERWKDADETLLTRENSGLTGIDADTFGVPSASPRPAFDGAAYASKLPGIYATVAPGQNGLWDPLGFCSQPGITKEKVDFYRDAEMKHGRVGMLASTGILLSESWHPFGGSQMDGVPAVSIFFNSSKYGTQLPGWFYVGLAAAVIGFEARAMGSDENTTTSARTQFDPGNFSQNAIQLKENQDTV